jgi:uncharacterized protein
LFLAMGSFFVAAAQHSYRDSIKAFIDDYVQHHEVVKGASRQNLHFFPVDESFKVITQFDKATDSKWFSVSTSGPRRKTYRIFGSIRFNIHDTAVKLDLYQAQDLLEDPRYSDYLLLMFTDKTSGIDSYEAGRYIDLRLGDIRSGKLVVDFNKAYNPYCAYVKNKYNCPIPPAENNLPVAITAGEKIFRGH